MPIPRCIKDHINGIYGLISFLTIIPIGKGIGKAGSYFFLSPLVGLIIGTLSGVIGYIGKHVFGDFMAGVIFVVSLELITGLHHLDGLLDFGDAVMVKGTREKRLSAMKDVNIGVGGFFFGTSLILSKVIAFSHANVNYVIWMAVVSELIAKTSMVFSCHITSGPAYVGSTSTSFIEGMKGSLGRIKLIASLLPVIVSSYLLFGWVGMIALLICLAISAIITAYSDHNFGGITGDVLGGIDEVTSAIVLITISYLG